MKKIILTLLICSVFTGFASAQVIPNFQFGVKGGVNLAAFPQSGVFSNSNQAGYVGGVWARFGALGFNFQPELYLTGKDVNTSYTDNNQVYTNKVKFTSLDLPLLFGGKIGAFGFGGLLVSLEHDRPPRGTVQRQGIVDPFGTNTPKQLPLFDIPSLIE